MSSAICSVYSPFTACVRVLVVVYGAVRKRALRFRCLAPDADSRTTALIIGGAIDSIVTEKLHDPGYGTDAAAEQLTALINSTYASWQNLRGFSDHCGLTTKERQSSRRSDRVRWGRYVPIVLGPWGLDEVVVEVQRDWQTPRRQTPAIERLVVMSSVGSPSTRSRSARSPGAIRPRSASPK
jgi:hypothetical protein